MNARWISMVAAAAVTAAPAWGLERPSPKPPPAAAAPAVTPLPEFQLPADTRPFTNDPQAGGIEWTGPDGDLQPYTTVTITFPTAMVDAGQIDAEEVESPVVLWPPVDAEFSWTTPTQGNLSITGRLIPGQTYRFRLREGLTDTAGDALPVAAWGAEAATPPFRLTDENYGERDSLNSRPQVPITFNYPVRLADAAAGVWFQDRATRQRFPAEIMVNLAEGDLDATEVIDRAVGTEDEYDTLRVRPLDPLPVGRFYDLVVDGIRDARAGRPLPYPRVFPLGPTQPLAVDLVAARNEPLESPRIEVKFRGLLDNAPLPSDALDVVPAVPNLRLRAEGQTIVAEGSFDTTKRYTVTVSDKILGAAGYGLARPERWGATFRPKRAAVLFPDRSIRERSALGLRFAFYQARTGPLEWKLAPVPLDKLPTVTNRLAEFEELLEDEDGRWLWNEDGLIQRAPTELLVPALGLAPVASGQFPATTDDAEVLREIHWLPETNPPAGPMLLEVSGRDAKGRLVGNRALIYFGDHAITRKETPTDTIVRVARMGDGNPVAGAKVTVLNDKLAEIASETTDANGVAGFAQATIPNAAYFLAGEAGSASTLQPLALSDAFPSGRPTAQPAAALRAFTFTDRPLYRPGQEVHFKGFVREESNGRLAAPAGRTVTWSIERSYAGEVFASGETQLDANGGWHAAWRPPEDGPIGYMALKVTVGNVPLGTSTRFQIEEFRNPPFSVICNKDPATRPAEAAITVASQYFHGAPNAGATVRWTATWVSDSDEGYYNDDDGTGMTRVNLHAENAPRPTFSAEVSGEAALDGNGRATLRCDAPFPDPGNRARCWVAWKVDVTGPDGQTITGGTSHHVPMAPVLLGVKREEAPRDTLQFSWDAATPFGTAPDAVAAELFHVVTKSVKERLAPNVYRYRNFDQFRSVEKRARVTGKTLDFTPSEPGRYVVVISPLPGAPGMPVSEQAWLAGDEPAEVPMRSDTAAEVMSLRDGRGNDSKPWLVGETAAIDVLSPSGGVAWVSVETDRLLDTFTVPLKGNASRIEIPVKAAYEPNAFVSVYILRPGGKDGLAGEFFGYQNLRVLAPDRKLDVAVAVERGEYEPREKVSGSVTVTANGHPVPGADLSICAVDDAILALGNWRLPEILDTFFPARNYAVATYSALRGFVDKISPSWLTMKGFVVGGGGADEFANVTFARKEFKPIILWLPSVRTDASGKAQFTCEAPENLTRFRVVAVGQTLRNQFGAGDATFTVTKKLLIEPALPRFVRLGDEIELRAVARQSVQPTDRLAVRCTVGGGLELVSAVRQEITAEKDAPAVVRFKARATGVGPATVKFEAVSSANAKLADAVEVTLPVAEPVILRRESVAGDMTGPAFAAGSVAPAGWQGAAGSFSLAVSTTPWLPKLQGLPYLIAYPHGCFEQKTSRLLAYTYLGGLLKFLPDARAQARNYGRVIDDTLNEINMSLLPDGMVPFWPQGTNPNEYVTIQTAWCVAQAIAAGFEVPERLASELPETLTKMVSRTQRADLPESLRAFALFVLTQLEGFDSSAAAAAANELFLRRDQLSDDSRAMLAIAMQAMEIFPDKQTQLVRELPVKFSDTAFNPRTFSSATRTEALCAWARLLITPGRGTDALQARLGKLMESSESLSTQENLWLLVAFNAFMKSNPPTAIATNGLAPAANAVAENRSAAAWTGQPLAKLAQFAVKGLPALRKPGSFVLTAAYRGTERDTPLESRGMRIERVVKNLTDPARTGAPDTPIRLGDQILISYRFSCDKPQSYVALEDLLPAGIEVVNPNLAMFGEFYAPPDEPGVTTAGLSHSEMRDQQTNLYFDRLPKGNWSYAVLARATAAGAFLWPATQIQPMYDSRFIGRSPSSRCVVTAE